MKKFDIEETLRILNEWVESWRLNFENPPKPFLNFTADEKGTLLLNQVPLCLVSSVDTDAQFVNDAEYLEFKLENNSCICIFLDWPFNGEPKVVSVEHHESLYIAG